MQIECPKCSTDNQITFDNKIACAKCDTELTGKAYRKSRKAIASTLLVFASGAVIAHNVHDRYIDKHRYPLKDEFAIIDLCVNGAQRPLASTAHAQKRSVCLCALEAVQKNVSASDVAKKPGEFMERFESAALSCRRELAYTAY